MKINSNFIIILSMIIIYQLYIQNKNKEYFSENKKPLEDLVKDKVNEIYLSDLEAIKNLTLISQKLQNGELNVNGNLNISGIVIEKTIKDLNDRISILDTDYNTLINNYNTKQKDYNDLNSNYNTLNTDYNTLNTNYNNLNTNYGTLSTNYDNLVIDRDNNFAALRRCKLNSM